MIMLNNGRMDLVMGGSAVSMIGAEKLSEEERRSAIKTFNETTKEASESFCKNIDKELKRSKQVKEQATNLEILPTNGNILVRMYNKNPWDQIKTTESGLIIPVYDGTYISHETGEKEVARMAVAYAEVVAVGPEVKYVRPGDDIIFINGTQRPTPFLGQALWVVSQNNVLVVINEELTERFSSIK